MRYSMRFLNRVVILTIRVGRMTVTIEVPP